jgi:hypothetical protein
MNAPKRVRAAIAYRDGPVTTRAMKVSAGRMHGMLCGHASNKIYIMKDLAENSGLLYPF